MKIVYVGAKKNVDRAEKHGRMMLNGSDYPIGHTPKRGKATMMQWTKTSALVYRAPSNKVSETYSVEDWGDMVSYNAFRVGLGELYIGRANTLAEAKTMAEHYESCIRPT